MQITSRLPVGDHLLLITFIVGFLATSGDPSTDPHAVPSGREKRLSFIILYYFNYSDHEFIIFNIFIIIFPQKVAVPGWGGAWSTSL